MGFVHKSVFFKESLDFLDIKKGGVYIDATIGAGGHSRGIVERGGKVIGFEIDKETVAKLEREEIRNLEIVNTNFTNLAKVVAGKELARVDGVLFDLGISSDQLEDSSLGISFQKDAPLDMRLDPALGVRAADLINVLAERQLYELFSKFGEERFARPIARAIVNTRRKEKIETTSQLVGVIEKVVGKKKGKTHPATKVFMALRIAVNNELENLKVGLEQAASVLAKNGRLVVISFHSLEDRIVKEFFQKESSLEILTKHPVLPSPEEINDNPRARSAKLRVAVKI